MIIKLPLFKYGLQMKEDCSSSDVLSTKINKFDALNECVTGVMMIIDIKG